MGLTLVIIQSFHVKVFYLNIIIRDGIFGVMNLGGLACSSLQQSITFSFNSVWCMHLYSCHKWPDFPMLHFEFSLAIHFPPKHIIAGCGTHPKHHNFLWQQQRAYTLSWIHTWSDIKTVKETNGKLWLHYGEMIRYGTVSNLYPERDVWHDVTHSKYNLFPLVPQFALTSFPGRVEPEKSSFTNHFLFPL